MSRRVHWWPRTLPPATHNGLTPHHSPWLRGEPRKNVTHDDNFNAPIFYECHLCGLEQKRSWPWLQAGGVGVWQKGASCPLGPCWGFSCGLRDCQSVGVCGLRQVTYVLPTSLAPPTPFLLPGVFLMTAFVQVSSTCPYGLE